jgi:hypothetical protein
MIKVYFEIKQKYAELVAIFDSEETYAVCLPSLEKLALENGFDIVTESIDEELSINQLVD